MQVEVILRSKGTVVHTLSETATLRDAVALLNRHNIGAVVITAGSGAIIGILSERDIVRRLAGDPSAVLSLPVTEAMTRGVITCTPDTDISEIMERMTNRRVRHVPVVADQALVGIVSIGDVVKRKIEETEFEAAALKDYIAS